MKVPDIIAIVIGALGLMCLMQVIELPSFITDLANNAFIATCLEGIAKYPTISTVCMYVASGVLILSGILRIWLETDTARYLWGIGSVALAVLLMIMLNDTVFAWAWTCELYSAGTTELVLTIFHFCWLFICPGAALCAAMMFSDDFIYTLPDPIIKAVFPFWAIPLCALGGFIASLVLFGVLLVVLIPLNYVFLVVDTIFIVIALIVVFILLKLGIL